MLFLTHLRLLFTSYTPWKHCKLMSCEIFSENGVGPFRLKQVNNIFLFKVQKQPSKGVLRKRCSENMQRIYRRVPMPMCDFNNVALQLATRNTYGRLLLKVLVNFFCGTPLNINICMADIN